MNGKTNGKREKITRTHDSEWVRVRARDTRKTKDKEVLFFLKKQGNQTSETISTFA